MGNSKVAAAVKSAAKPPKPSPPAPSAPNTGSRFPRFLARLVTVFLALGVVGFGASLLLIFAIEIRGDGPSLMLYIHPYLDAASLDIGSVVPSLVTSLAAALPLIIAASCYNDINGTRQLSFLGMLAALLFMLAAFLAFVFIMGCQVNSAMSQLMGATQLAKLTANVTGVMSFCTIYFLQLLNWRPK